MLNESIKHGLVCVFACIFGAFAHATDYFVSTEGSDDNAGTTAETAFATVDKAITTAKAEDVIYVAAGTYTTTTRNSPEVKCKLVGNGTTRGEVIIQAGDIYRALKTVSTACITNLTIVGNTATKTANGGAVYMNGGTIVDCVIKDGTSTGDGGNIYTTTSPVTIRNCEISGGITSGGQGGNIYLQVNGSVVEDCLIENGKIGNVSGKYGANVFLKETTRMSRCHLKGGSHDYTADPNAASLIVSYSSTAIVEDCLIEGSTCGGLVLPGGNTHLYNLAIVNNVGAGVWAWNASQLFYNTIVYGNVKADGTNRDWAGNKPGSSGAFVNCAVGANSGFTAGSYSGLILLDSSDCFEDYANGNYRPAKGGALVDAGIEDPRRNDASETDLAANPRAVGKVDIGCYEYQPESFYATFYTTYEGNGYYDDEITFVAVPRGTEASVSYIWDFGDGTEAVSTESTEVSHTYSNGGLYTIKLTAKAGDETFTQERTGYLIVYGGVVWVNSSATPQIPYLTAETALTTLPEALAIYAGRTGEIRLEPGKYEVSAQQTITSPITICGTGKTPDDVVVSNTATASASAQYKRVFEIDNVGARVENLTMAGGRVYNQSGGNLRLVSGMVTNCVIRNGQITVSGGNGGGGGVELAGTGILTHCWVTNNLVSGTAGDTWGAGGAVFISYNSKGRLDNTLIAYNTYIATVSGVRGSAGLQVGGNNDTAVIENCTIVSNVVQGTLLAPSAGVWSDSSWYTTFRNCVIAGNYQTGTMAFSSCQFTSYSKVYNCVVDVMPKTTKYYGDSTGFTLGDIKSMFKDFEGGDFTPMPGSVLANKGTTPAYAAAVDLAGNKRVFGKAIDIGCYEVQRNPGFLLMIR